MYVKQNAMHVTQNEMYVTQNGNEGKVAANGNIKIANN